MMLRSSAGAGLGAGLRAPALPAWSLSLGSANLTSGRLCSVMVTAMSRLQQGGAIRRAGSLGGQPNRSGQRRRRLTQMPAKRADGKGRRWPTPACQDRRRLTLVAGAGAAAGGSSFCRRPRRRCCHWGRPGARARPLRRCLRCCCLRC